MASLPELVQMLVGALQRPYERHELVRAFQAAIGDEPESFSHGAAWDVLSALAADLEFYVPDPELRGGHPSYFGDDRFRQEVLSALRDLIDVGVVRSIDVPLA